MTLAIHDQRLAEPGSHDTPRCATTSWCGARSPSSREHWRDAADHRGHGGRRRRHAERAAPSVPPLGRYDAEGLHAGADARSRATACCAIPRACSMPRYDVGLSGPGRLHDLFVTHEAMSPGEWKSGGAGLTLRFGFHPSPFGTAIVIATDRGLVGPRLRRSRRGSRRRSPT